MLTMTCSAQKKLSAKLGITNVSDHDLNLITINQRDFKKRFRIKVNGGGCSGFQYKFLIDENLDDDDIIFSDQELNLQVVIDKHSLPLVDGSTVDYSTSLSGEYFFLKNPNAKANCGCGNSFSV